MEHIVKQAETNMYTYKFIFVYNKNKHIIDFLLWSLIKVKSQNLP
jgi:hypothetical protein